MTTTTLALVATIAFAAGTAHADHIASEEPRTLARYEIDDVVKTVSNELQRCYLDVAGDVKGAGHLDVKLGIFRKGTIYSVEVATPGVPAKLAKKIDACVRTTVAKLKFPARKADTTVVIPYFFQKTAATNAGPYESCWNPRGCH
jgi:hypothetical protein